MDYRFPASAGEARLPGITRNPRQNRSCFLTNYRQQRPYFGVPDPLPLPMPEPEPGVVGEVVLLPEPLEPLEPVDGLGVLLPLELEPLELPDAPAPAEPFASLLHLSSWVPVRPAHLLASLPDAPDAAPEVELSLEPEDELPAAGADGEAPVLLEPEDWLNAAPDRARSAAAVAAVRVFNIMEGSPSKGE